MRTTRYAAAITAACLLAPTGAAFADESEPTPVEVIEETAPEPAAVEETAPEPAPVEEPEPEPVPEPDTEPAIPEFDPAPGESTDWIGDDGEPTEEWFQEWRDAHEERRSPSWYEGNSTTGDVNIGGWSYVNADGSAGDASIVCGSFCNSGYVPTEFGPDGVPTAWRRVVQQALADSNGNVAGTGASYRPGIGWTATGPGGATLVLNPNKRPDDPTAWTCVDRCGEPGEEAVIEYVPETDGIPDARVPELVTPQVTTTEEGHYQVQVRVADPGTTGTVEVMVRLEPGNWRRLTADVVDGVATRYLPARYEGLRYTIRNDGEPVARGNLEVTTTP